MSLFPFSILVCSLVAGADDPQDAKKMIASLQGRWVMVGAEVEGRKAPDKEYKDGLEVLVIQGTTITYLNNGKEQQKFAFAIDPSKNPALIDLTHDTGDDKGKTNYAILELKGDELKLRVNNKFKANAKEDRPSKFTTTEGRCAFLVILKRAPK